MKIIKTCIRNILGEINLENLALKYVDVSAFYKSQWQRGEHSWLYLVFRWIWALFFLALFTAILILTSSEGKMFIFLTNWGITFCLLTNFTAAIMVTIWHFNVKSIRTLNGRNRNCIVNTEVSSTTDQSLSIYIKLYWLLYNITLPLALVITTVFWMFLDGKMKKPQRFPILSLFVHCLNSVFMIADFFIVAVPFRLLHIIYSMLFPIFYWFFSLLYYINGGTDEFGNPWIYPILNWQYPIYCIKTFGGVFLLYVAYYVLLINLQKLKYFLYRTLKNAYESSDILFN